MEGTPKTWFKIPAIINNMMEMLTCDEATPASLQSLEIPDT
jgi:hypothetical protein